MAEKSGKRKGIGMSKAEALDLKHYLDDLPPVLRVVRFKKSLVVVCVGCRQQVGSAYFDGMLVLKLKHYTPCRCGPGINMQPMLCCSVKRDKDAYVVVETTTGITKCGQCHQLCGKALCLPYDGDIVVVFESLYDQKNRRAVTIC